MLQQLVGATGNITEGVLDLYDLIVAVMRKSKDAEPEQLIVAMATEFAQALEEKPQMRRATAMLCASFIGMDRWINGEDYNTAMNESRDLCLKALTSSTFVLDAYRLYTSKKDAVIAVFEQIESDMNPDGALTAPSEYEQYAVILQAVRHMVWVVRQP
jgi:hypothetical protein